MYTFFESVLVVLVSVGVIAAGLIILHVALEVYNCSVSCLFNNLKEKLKRIFK
jgi:hypothetical protein